MASSGFDPLTATASSLQYMLENNGLTSVQIIDTYLQQIHKFNHKGPCLNALISVAPRDILILTAGSLDEERRQGKVRSPLHGIPIILKVTTRSIWKF
jgi:amidase